MLEYNIDPDKPTWLMSAEGWFNLLVTFEREEYEVNMYYHLLLAAEAGEI